MGDLAVRGGEGEGQFVQVGGPAALEIARGIARACMVGGLRGIVWWRGEFWRWEQGEWRKQNEEGMRHWLWRVVERCCWEKVNGKTGLTEEEWVVPSRSKVGEVMEALAAVTRLDVDKMPVWLGQGRAPFEDPELVVATRDGLVDLLESGRRGQLVVRERGPEWLDVMTVGTDVGGWDGTATEWDEQVRRWGDGDGEWKELVERWMGYTLMGTRRYQRWCIQVGVSGSGKGTLTRLWSALCGREHLLGATWESLTDGFGTDGLQSARLVVVGEGGEHTERAVRGKAGSMLKMVVGEDPLTVNLKYGARLKGVVSPAAVMVQANATPEMSDGGGAITSKMLVLPYRVGNRGAEDVGLGARLVAGGRGCVGRWLEAAARLVVSPVAERWPTVEEGREVEQEMREREENVYAEFLEDVFEVGDVGGTWVSGELVRALARRWAQVRGRSFGCNEQYLLVRLERDSRKNVRRGKEPGGTRNGLKGVRVKVGWEMGLLG